ncbi:MerR family transcriptional regulator, partial [Paenibacillus tundrae]|nr:MerR family transcriptional regulator [Paenibacillus tundrae]
MKNDYKINEISKLYGIGVDALRYYEKLGLLVPRRDGNGYRLYSLQDMYKLNIIRDLRQLDFT